jgi:hypothetical protein
MKRWVWALGSRWAVEGKRWWRGQGGSNLGHACRRSAGTRQAARSARIVSVVRLADVPPNYRRSIAHEATKPPCLDKKSKLSMDLLECEVPLVTEFKPFSPSLSIYSFVRPLTDRWSRCKHTNKTCLILTPFQNTDKNGGSNLYVWHVWLHRKDYVVRVIISCCNGLMGVSVH